MAYFSLFISGNLTNLTNVQPQDGCDDPENRYYFKVRCSWCGEIGAKVVYVTLGYTRPSHWGFECHMPKQCRQCFNHGLIVMVEGLGGPLTRQISEAGGSAKIMTFYCEDIIPLEFEFRGVWTADCADGTTVEFRPSNGDFVSHDNNGQAISVTGLAAEFIEG